MRLVNNEIAIQFLTVAAHGIITAATFIRSHKLQKLRRNIF